MTVTAADIAALVVALLSGGLITAVLAWRRDRRQAPIERRQANEASAEVASRIRNADIDGLREIIESLREEGSALRGRVETVELRAAAAEARAVAAEARAERAENRAIEADHYIDRLLAAWPSPPPPPPRIPAPPAHH